MGRGEMKSKKSFWIVLVVSFAAWCGPVLSYAHGHGHGSVTLSVEAIDEMIGRLQRLKARIPKGGVLKLTREEMLAWHIDEMKHDDDYKNMKPEERRQMDAMIAKARRELRQQIEKKESAKNLSGKDGARTNDEPVMKIIPKKRKKKNSHPKKRFPKKVIPANV